MKTTDNLVIIPARKNSQRIKDKNLLRLGKKSLVEMTIEFALKISDKNSVYLSTDSKKIKKIGEKYGIFCPSLRPSSLSKSNSNSVDVCLHALKTFESLKDCKVKNIILLQPTSPFRSVNIYNKAFKIFDKNKKPTFTVSYLTANKIIQNYKGLKFVSNSSKKFYQLNGNVYIIKVKDLKKQKSFFGKNFNILIIKSKKLSIDIDTVYDVQKAKKFL
ncbi:hypothetical protein OAQ31_00035 [Candidatus Pelagibacter sp.]|nr:hypothetical protein [Candidatus Pelagibacter sp.]